MVEYKGASHRISSVQCIFDSTEKFVFGADDSSDPAVVVWDAQTGELLQRLTGHNQRIGCLAASQVDCVFVSGSDDHRSRFWGPSTK